MKWTRPYQKGIHDFIVDNEKVAEFVDMGLGKTMATATALQTLLDRFDIRGALLVSTQRICRLTWPDELAKWPHLRGLRYSPMLGTPTQRNHAYYTQADLYAVNFENLIWTCDQMEEDERHGRILPFDTLVIDESSKMKDGTSKRFRRLRPHLQKFRRVIIMSGTPKPESYEDLWAQVFLLDGGARLGRYVTHFREAHFTVNPWNRFDIELRDGHDAIINEKIADLAIVLRAEDHIKLPPITHIEVTVELPKPLHAKYRELEKDMFTQLDSGEAIEGFSEGAAAIKCRQFTGGAVYEYDAAGVEVTRGGRRVYTTIHDVKLDALAELVEEAQGAPILVAYAFAHERERILARFPAARGIGAGVSPKVERETLAAWNAGRLPMLVVHPASAGHGLNLQDGGHIIVWYSLVYSGEQFEQLPKRLHRSGQRSAVLVYRLMMKGTVDYAVLAKATAKNDSQAAFLKTLKELRDCSLL